MRDSRRDKDELEATARAMALALAGSCSGGESTHLCNGFTHPSPPPSQQA